MSKEEKNSKKRWVDKVLMGAVIGGAIGSVVGATIAPKKGKKTREELAKTAEEAKKKGSKFFKIIKKLIFRKKDSQGVDKEGKKIPHEHV